jgi:hypothetical protein
VTIMRLSRLTRMCIATVVGCCALATLYRTLELLPPPFASTLPPSSISSRMLPQQAPPKRQQQAARQQALDQLPRCLTGQVLRYTAAAGRGRGTGRERGALGSSRPVPMAPALQALWQRAEEQGLMAYNPVGLATRTVHHGRVHFELVHNPGRASKRKTLPPAPPRAKVSLLTPFDPSRFNFHRADARETLFEFRVGHGGSSSDDLAEAAFAAADGAAADIGPGFSCESLGGSGVLHGVLVNHYPLSPFSGLLVPFMPENRSQVSDNDDWFYAGDDGGAAITFNSGVASFVAQLLGADSFAVALAFAQSLGGRSDPRAGRMLMGFNSLGAGASVNHLHWQFWQKQQGTLLPVETVARKLLRVGRDHSHSRPRLELSVGGMAVSFFGHLAWAPPPIPAPVG